MKVSFHTNLDLAQPYMLTLNNEWNDRHHPIPSKGDKISFSFTKLFFGKSSEYAFELEVCGITFDAKGNWVKVELHIPSYFSSMTLAGWEEHFRRHVLGKDY